jgi:hypothetical protein
MPLLMQSGASACLRRPQWQRQTTKLWDEFGYPDTLTFDNFYRQYRRGSTGFAAVHKLLDSCWMDRPTIIDGDEDRSRRNYALGKVSHQADEEALGEN